MLYAILFSGPQRKNIWWNEDGPYGHKVMTFSNINEAFQWSAKATSQFPHCQYLVQEYEKKEKTKSITKTKKPICNACKATKSRET